MKAGEKTTQSSFFNVSLLIVHCRLRDIVILTIHLYLHVSHNNNINNINNNRNCILLLQIYRCAACVSVYVYAVLSSCFIQKRRSRSTRLGESLRNLRRYASSRKATIQRYTGKEKEEEEVGKRKRRYFLAEIRMYICTKKKVV